MRDPILCAVSSLACDRDSVCVCVCACVFDMRKGGGAGAAGENGCEGWGQGVMYDVCVALSVIVHGAGGALRQAQVLGV